MDITNLARSAGAPEILVKALSRVDDRESAFEILGLVLTGRKTPSGEEWTIERLKELAQWQAETGLPAEVTDAVTTLNEFLAGGKYDISVNDTTIIVSPKKPSFLVPKRTTTRRGRNGEVVITLVINNEEIPVSSFSELVRALGEEPRHEHGLKQAAPLARMRGATILIGGRPSETVVKFAQANSDVIKLS